MENSKIVGGSSRRKFMQQLALCYVAAHIPLSFLGCKDDDPNFVGTGKPPYKVWEEMLMALQTCPDYLEGRMKILINSKDTEAMFNFVRDEIYLMPTSDSTLRAIGPQYKWGIKGALRYGMATPREKAELLNQMLTEAGFVSKVMYERTNILPEEAMSFFFRPIERNYNLQVSKKQWKRWKEELNLTTDQISKFPVFDPNFSKANALADNLWDLIPDKEKLRIPSFDFRWDNYRTPTVEFESNGEKQYAHLFDPKIPFGEKKNDDRGVVVPADPVGINEEKINISISYRDSIHTHTETELVSGEWKATELIGNQINLAFMHGLSLEQQAVTEIGSLRIFTPALALQSFDEDLQVLQENSFLGNPFTLDGKKIDLTGEEPKINGVTLAKKPNKELQKQVIKLQIKAIPAHYPLVKLEVTPTDLNDKFVESLTASDFFITDNGNPLQVLMESNRPTPRILMLYDTSLSMPPAYYRENMDAFIETFHQRILDKYPAALITKWETPSELFTYLLKASKSDYDLIIYATDGDNVDSYNAADEKIYKNGAPAIVLDVNDLDYKHTNETFNKMAEITNGMVFPAKDQEKTLDAIVDYIHKMEIPPYVFTYYATGETEVHTVKVGLDNHRVVKDDTFNFLGGLDHSDEVGLNLIGLYCRIKYGNQEVKRVLAGWDPLTQRNLSPINSHYLDVKSLILGGSTFYFEGEGPTMATALVDLLKYKLSTRSWGEALLEADLTLAKTEYEKGVLQYHSKAMALMGPIQNQASDTSFTFASGMRIGICKQQLHIENKKVVESFDFLPTSKYVSFAKDSDESFKINLHKTAQLAIREGSLFDTSAFSALKDTALIERSEAIAKNWFNDLDRKSPDYYYWLERLSRGNTNFKLFDPLKSSQAFWEINVRGELYGMLGDGTGGGSSDETVEGLEKIMKIITIYTAISARMAGMNPIGVIALGVVAAYGLTLVKLYAIVCETLVIMDTSGMDEKIAEALKELATNVARAIMFVDAENPISMPGLLKLIGQLAGDANPFD